MKILKFLGKTIWWIRDKSSVGDGSAISRVSSSEIKQCSERSQRIHFNSSKSKNTLASVVRYFILAIVNWNSVVSVVTDFILTIAKKDNVVGVVSEVKQRSERSQIFHFNSSEAKQSSERSWRFLFNCSEVKQRSDCSQWRKTA